MSGRSDSAPDPQTRAWLDRQQGRLEEETVVIDYCEPEEEGALAFGGLLWHHGAIWHLSGRLVRRRVDARLVIPAISVRAVRPDDEALTTRILKALPLELVRQRVISLAREKQELDLWSDALLGTALTDGEVLDAVTQVPPLGRSGTPDSFFAELATDAVRIAIDGGNVRRVLAERRQRSERRVQEWLTESRVRGYLDPAARVWRLGPAHPNVSSVEAGDRRPHVRRKGEPQ
jgi:hypothetical protein